MHVDGAGLQQIIGVPDLLHDPLAGQYLLGMLQKQMQQRVFLVGQLNGCAAHTDRAGHIVQHDLTEMQGGRSRRGGGRPRAAQHGPHAGDKFHDAERLAEVVVRAVVQTLDDINFAGLGCDHNDRQVCAGGVGAQLVQDLVAVLIGQHHIQNDQLGPGLAHGGPEAGGVLAAACVIAVGLQRVLLQLTDAGIVFDNVNHKINLFLDNR